MKIGIGIADDQQLFLGSLSLLVDSYSSFEVTVTALNGEALLQRLAVMKTPPDIVLLDVNMPKMGGMATAAEVARKYPLIRMVALSMKDDDISIIGMLRVGCCAYLLKDIGPAELEKALLEINARGYYNADAYNINYRGRRQNRADAEPEITENERAFLQLASSDRTYKQIAAEMHLSARTIDGYREALFEKLSVQSRVGMVLEAIKRQLVTL
jgi:DNA-binding NarL/FixJ family response regulator